jgi:sigma-E factor negative regulatory protein RseB
MRWLVIPLACWAGLALAGEPLPGPEAAALLQRMADAARRLPYEGQFYLAHGDLSRAMRVVNTPSAAGKSSLLVFMDGPPQEVRCERGGSVSITSEGHTRRLERRMNSRYFPDLLPADAAALAAWYTVRLGNPDRVADLPCQDVHLQPRDHYRWGYVLCAEKNSYLPLRVEMRNDAGKSLLKYAFTQVSINRPITVQALPRAALAASEGPVPAADAPILVRQLPPGFVRVAAVKRTLPNRPGEVEHWVFSDGLTYISLFLEHATQPVEQPVKGESGKGMINLLTRQVGNWRVTVLGDAPWPAVEAVAMNLAAKP